MTHGPGGPTGAPGRPDGPADEAAPWSSGATTTPGRPAARRALAAAARRSPARRRCRRPRRRSRCSSRCSASGGCGPSTRPGTAACPPAAWPPSPVVGTAYLVGLFALAGLRDPGRSSAAGAVRRHARLVGLARGRRARRRAGRDHGRTWTRSAAPSRTSYSQLAGRGHESPPIIEYGRGLYLAYVGVARASGWRCASRRRPRRRATAAGEAGAGAAAPAAAGGPGAEVGAGRLAVAAGAPPGAGGPAAADGRRDVPARST